MKVELTWLGHGSWLITSGGHRIVLDPFLTSSPVAPLKADDVEVDHILVSHGHFDHVEDVASIARRTSANVIAVYETAEWFTKNHGLKNVTGMNTGGSLQTPFGRVKMTPALHSSSLPDGSYGGQPAGFLITISGKNIYFACDTALFSDMKLIGGYGVHLAVLPIGDLYTMGVEDSIQAVKLIKPSHVAPAHYNTWPPIEQDAAAWARMVKEETGVATFTPEPGGVITLD